MSRFSLWAAALLFAFCISGCRSLAPPVTYYTLNAALGPVEGAVDHGNGRLIIGIRSVDLPGYVNRLPMVTRRGSNTLRFASLHRWADYPDRMIQQALAENLQWLLPQVRVIRAPWPVEVRPDVVLSFEFLELIGTADGTVAINGVWSFYGTAPEAVAHSYRVALTVPITGDGFGGLAEAHSRGIETLSRDVADVLKRSYLPD
jgi:uncharacterized protein